MRKRFYRKWSKRMKSDRMEKTEKSGLFLLESYIVPGYVSYTESGRGGEKAVKPLLSPALREAPEVLRALNEDVGELTAFVKRLMNDPSMRVLPVGGSEGPCENRNAGIFLLNGFKQGFLRFYRDRDHRPTLTGTGRCFSSVPNARELLGRFAEVVNGYGPADEVLTVAGNGTKTLKDRLIRLNAAEPNEYDTVNAEFTFTHLPDPGSETGSIRSETVRENAEMALRKTTELLKELTEEAEGGKE